MESYARFILIRLSEKIFDFAYYLLRLGSGNAVDQVTGKKPDISAPDDQHWFLVAHQSGHVYMTGFVGADEALKQFKRRMRGQILMCRNLDQMRTEIELAASFASGKAAAAAQPLSAGQTASAGQGD